MGAATAELALDAVRGRRDRTSQREAVRCQVDPPQTRRQGSIDRAVAECGDRARAVLRAPGSPTARRHRADQLHRPSPPDRGSIARGCWRGSRSAYSSRRARLAGEPRAARGVLDNAAFDAAAAGHASTRRAHYIWTKPGDLRLCRREAMSLLEAGFGSRGVSGATDTPLAMRTRRCGLFRADYRAAWASTPATRVEQAYPLVFLCTTRRRRSNHDLISDAVLSRGSPSLSRGDPVPSSSSRT